MKRRVFLTHAPAVLGAPYLLKNSYADTNPESESRMLPKRKLGKTGEMLSIIGFGGIVVRDADPKVAGEVVAKSIEKGINYFDVAPSYGDAEVKLGPALKPFRDRVFLACKTGERDKEGEAKHPKCWYEPVEDPFLAEDALSWTLSQGVTAAIPPGDENLFKLALQIGPNIKPVSPDISERLQKLAEGLEPIFKA